MYVTRYLSHYKSSPESLYSPPEGPNSGYLVIQDEESETYSCFGLCKNRYLRALPFPQNKTLTIYHTRQSRIIINYQHVSTDEVVLIPVLNQPLSSNRYYAIKPQESCKGEAFTCSKEEDRAPSCFCILRVRDVKTRPLDPHDMYQQFEVVLDAPGCGCGGGEFHVKSLAKDGYPPKFLRRLGWQIYAKTPKNYELSEAKGINNALRSRLPDLNFSSSTKSSDSIVVGKWYCPFVFIKEGTMADQVKKSMYYEMTLEQRWERVFEKENDQGNVVSVKGAICSEAVFIGENGREAIWDERHVVDGAVWFTCARDDYGKEESVGLSLEIVQIMKWEEEKVGWVGVGNKRIDNVNKQEKYEGSGVWKRFGCYVLVERFVLKRMDGSLVLAYDFGHAHQIKSVFE